MGFGTKSRVKRVNPSLYAMLISELGFTNLNLLIFDGIPADEWWLRFPGMLSVLDLGPKPSGLAFLEQFLIECLQFKRLGVSGF